MEIQLPTMSEEKIKTIMNDITSTLLKKNEDYGSASFDLGLNGNMVHLWDKIKRYRNLVEKAQSNITEPNFESIEDTLKDTIGYAIIGLLILEHNNKKLKNG